MPRYRIVILSVVLLLGACASAGADIALPTATPAVQRLAPQVTATTRAAPAQQPLPTSSPTAPTATSAPTATPRPTDTRVPAATATSRPAATSTPQPTLPPATPTSQPPTATTPPQSGNCDPAYPDVCIPPPPPDLDCGEIPHRLFTVLPPDPHRFDGDKNGLGCEST